MYLVVAELVISLVALAIGIRKGYSGLIWFLGANVISVVVLLCLPSTRGVPFPLQDDLKKRKTGNRVGLWFICVNLVFGLILLIAHA